MKINKTLRNLGVATALTATMLSSPVYSAGGDAAATANTLLGTSITSSTGGKSGTTLDFKFNNGEGWATVNRDGNLSTALEDKIPGNNKNGRLDEKELLGIEDILGGCPVDGGQTTTFTFNGNKLTIKPLNTSKAWMDNDCKKPTNYSGTTSVQNNPITQTPAVKSGSSPNGLELRLNPKNLVVGLVETNPGQSEIAVFVGDKTGYALNSYLTLGGNNIVKTPAGNVNFSQEQLSAILKKGGKMSPTRTTANSNVVALLNKGMPQITTGYEFMIKDPERFGSRDVANIMTQRAKRAEMYVNQNVAFLSQIEKDKFARFLENSATILIPLPGIELWANKDTALTGNRLVDGVSYKSSNCPNNTCEIRYVNSRLGGEK